MTLPSPNLDDRRFDDLVAEAQRRIRLRCPEWTDLGPSDPGMTLIEAFAHMTDELTQRLNQVPERLYLRFMELVGIRLRPPSAARTGVTFWLTTALPTSVTVAAGTRVATLRNNDDDAVVFSTLRDLELPSVSLQHAVVIPQAEDAEGVLLDLTGIVRKSTPMFSSEPVPGDALYLGLSQPAPRCMVRVDFAGRVEGIGVDPSNPPLAWDAWTGEDWQPCPVVDDATGGFNLPGAVLVQLPERHDRSVVDGRAAAWLRVRLTTAQDGQPTYRSAPVIDTLHASVAGGTTDAVHAELIAVEDLGTSDGVPGQVYALAQRPVLPLTDVQVEVSSDEGWQEWQLVDSFAGSGPTDHHVLLDHVAGHVVFGPAVRDADGGFRHFGAVPDKAAAIRLRNVAIGGGRAGNVAAGALQVLRSSLPFIGRVENLTAAQGGTEGETVEEAKLRTPLAIRSRGRAVTAADFEYYATEVAPEAARIVCGAAGADGSASATVRVLVVPAAAASAGRIQFEDLVPREDVLRRIAERLDEVRLIGTHIVVEPPRYRGITVVARVRATTRADENIVHDAALDALYGFLNPLPGGGPVGQGWPFGRPVQAGELYAVLQRVTGVELVEDVRLFSADPITGERGDQAARVDIDRYSLVFSYDHHVRVQR